MIPTFLYLSCSTLALCELNSFNLSLTGSCFYYHLLALTKYFLLLEISVVNLVICSTSYDFWSFCQYGDLLSLAVI